MAFRTAIAGLMHKNPDGTHRIDILEKCQIGEDIQLLREPDNPHDESAIAVYRETGEQLGYLPQKVAAGQASRMDGGSNPSAIIVEMSIPGTLGLLFGKNPCCLIEISGG